VEARVIDHDVPDDLLTGHWDWRPDWTAERRNWWWYATFEADSTVQRLVSNVQKAIRPSAPVDRIPLRWLHLSLAEVGYVADLPPAVPYECARAAREALAEMRPSSLRVGPVVAMRGALVLGVRASHLEEIHDGLMAAVAATSTHPPVQRPFAPHVSVAYVRHSCSSADVFENTPTPEVASTQLTEIALVEVVRGRRHYRWTPRHRLALG
jgi:2'-5' RNA ligase